MEIESLYNYKVTSFQGLLQILVDNLLSRGYYYFCLVELPAHKSKKWEQIDKKLIDKYQTNKSKWQRHRAKEKGLANFFYLRFEGLAIILHTLGDVPGDIKYDDLFQDIRKKVLTIKISDTTSFDIYAEKKKTDKSDYKINVKISKNTYFNKKAIFAELEEKKDRENIIKEFRMLNGYPCYAGVIQQKRQLQKYILNQARKHQFTLSSRELLINTKRKMYDVWNKGGVQSGSPNCV